MLTLCLLCLDGGREGELLGRRGGGGDGGGNRIYRRRLGESG